MSSNVVLQPNPPYLTDPLFSMPEIPFCNPPKKSNLHHCLKSQLSKENIFLTELCGLLWVFFVLVRVSQREQESKNLPVSLSLSHLSLSPSSISSCPSLSLSFFSLKFSLSLLPTYISSPLPFFLLPIPLLLSIKHTKLFVFSFGH